MTEQHDARHLLELAELAATAGDLVSADELLKDAARIQEHELGPHHPDLANTLTNLAIVAERTGSSSDAETLYHRAAAIAAAALPFDHPMTVTSRQNLEAFCRERGLSIDAPAVTKSTWDTENAFRSEQAEAGQMPVRPDNTRKGSHSIQWLATGAVVLVAAASLLLRPWSSRDASTAAPPPRPEAAQPAESVAPQNAAPPATPVPIEPSAPPAAAPPRDDQNVPTKMAPAANGIAVVTAQLCRTFSTSGGNWSCDPVNDTAMPGPMVFYTRVRTPRDTTVVHRWYRGGTLQRSVTLNIRANSSDGYRTYSRAKVTEGDWRLEVTTADGNSLHEQRFVVQ